MRQPDDGRRPDPHRRGRAARSSTATPTARSATRPAARACSRTSSACWRGGRWASSGPPSSASARPSTHAGATRRLDRRAVPRGGRPRARRRGADAGRHRRRRHRQGARLLRGRDDARAVPGRRARRGRQADVPRAHRRLGRRLDRRSWRRSLVAGRRPRAGAHRRVREAVRVRGHVGAVARRCRSAAAARRRRRLLRAAHPLLHPPLAARPTTSACWSRSRTGATRCEPVRAPAPARHHVRLGPGVADAVGPDPLRRDLPVLRRRLRDGARRRGRGPASAAAAGRWRGSGAPRCAASRRCSPARPGQPAGRARTRAAASTRRPASPTRAREIDVRRDVRAVLLVRADVAGEPRLRRARARAGS